jgi:N-acetylneuraminate synthase
MMPNLKTYIIAEAGVNHNGRIDYAEKLIVEASRIGADAIKFQTFQSDEIVHPSAAQAEYQKKNTKGKTQYELLENLELSKEQFRHLKKIADNNNIQFLSTPFDLKSLDFLLNMGLPYIKISSGDLTYGPLLLKAAQCGVKILISTGMATLEEIREALFVLAYGYANPNSLPKSFKEILDFAYNIDWKTLLCEKVTLFHCTSEYPAPYSEINLNVLETYKKEFGLDVGYSDHSLGVIVPMLAVAKGACIIEKHLTLDNKLEGPDHKASLNVDTFAEMVRQIRLTESILGSFKKFPTVSELKNKPLVRRGVYVNSDVKKSEVYQQENLIYLRPATYFTPMQSWDLLGKKAAKNLKRLDAVDE